MRKMYIFSGLVADQCFYSKISASTMQYLQKIDTKIEKKWKKDLKPYKCFLKRAQSDRKITNCKKEQFSVVSDLDQPSPAFFFLKHYFELSPLHPQH